MPCWNNDTLWVEQLLTEADAMGQNAYWWSSIPTTAAVFSLDIFESVQKGVQKWPFPTSRKSATFFACC